MRALNRRSDASDGSDVSVATKQRKTAMVTGKIWIHGAYHIHMSRTVGANGGHNYMYNTGTVQVCRINKVKEAIWGGGGLCM